jgi:release factor glutamine methyltransferase
MLEKKELDLLKTLVSKKPYEYIISHPELNFNFWQKLKLAKLTKQRQKGIPFAYLNKKKEFFSLEFLVNKNTLIPRPDTEIMIEEILSILKTNNFQNNFLIDVGTGTACIPISILKNTNKFEKTFAIDISRKALSVAKKNNKKHKTNINFLKGDLLNPFLNKKINLQNKNIFISANLPYLTLEQFKKEKSIQAEPKIALVTRENGLYLYKKLFNQIKKIKAKNVFVFCEIDPRQTLEIEKNIKNIFPNIDIIIKKDYSNLDRLVYFKI